MNEWVLSGLLSPPSMSEMCPGVFRGALRSRPQSCSAIRRAPGTAGLRLRPGRLDRASPALPGRARCSGAAAVDKGLDQGVDGPLDGRCNEYLLEGVLALERLGRIR